MKNGQNITVTCAARNIGKTQAMIQSLIEENNKLKELLGEVLEDGGFRNFEVQERCRQILDPETK